MKTTIILIIGLFLIASVIGCYSITYQAKAKENISFGEAKGKVVGNLKKEFKAANILFGIVAAEVDLSKELAVEKKGVKNLVLNEKRGFIDLVLESLTFYIYAPRSVTCTGELIETEAEVEKPKKDKK